MFMNKVASDKLETAPIFILIGPSIQTENITKESLNRPIFYAARASKNILNTKRLIIICIDITWFNTLDNWIES